MSCFPSLPEDPGALVAFHAVALRNDRPLSPRHKALPAMLAAAPEKAPRP